MNGASHASVPCVICESDADKRLSLQVLGDERTVFQCEACEAAFFSNPDWLDVAYSDAISSRDTGVVERCVDVANVLTAFMWRTRHDKALDFGGGIGLLARLMRDRGFDFTSWDPISNYVLPLPPSHKEGVHVLTMIEVLEHLVDPLTSLRECMSRSDIIFISTHLIPSAGIQPHWAYLQPDTGQHIFFCSNVTLEKIALLLGVSITSNGENLHVFHRHPLTVSQRAAIRYQRIAWVFGHVSALFTRRRGLADQDASNVVDG